jgi:pimeloyl-ACP methyl ester carboxylesterase
VAEAVAGQIVAMGGGGFSMEPDNPLLDDVVLKLATGTAVQALIRVKSGGGHRTRCLLLHGNPGSLLDWRALVPRLPSDVDVAAIDLPGFGRSTRPHSEPHSLSLDRLAEHALAAADALSWREPLVLVGHSHGGGIAQVLAARYPERVAGLVLVGTLGTPAHGSYRLLALPGAETIARLVGRVFGAKWLRPISRKILGAVMKDLFSPHVVPAVRLESELESFSRHPEILTAMVHVALGRPCAQLRAAASSIRCPSVFLHGSEDRVVPVRHARAIHEPIVQAGGRSHFEAFSGAGHMLMQDRPAEIAEHVLRSLNHMA